MGSDLLKTIEGTKLYFDDLTVGDQFKTVARTMTEADIVSFAGLSGDFNALHTDGEFAVTTAHGQRIAHGLLVLAIAEGGGGQLRVRWGSALHRFVVVERIARFPSAASSPALPRGLRPEGRDTSLQEGRVAGSH